MEIIKSLQGRRTFLKTLTMLGAAAAVSPMLQRSALADGYTTVGKLTDFKVGDYSRVVLPDGTALYVERSPGDPSSVVALLSACTHRGCAVLWVSSDKEFKCPCHGGKYDKDGINISGPPKSPLKKLDAKVVNGDVQVSQ